MLEHPDRDEIISKLLLNVSEKDISEWLAAKYSNATEKKFALTQACLKEFKRDHLDIYATIRNDLNNAKLALKNGTEDQVSLALQDNPTYKSELMNKLSSDDLDVKKMLANMIMAVEIRVGNYFDEMQADPRNLDTRKDRVMIELMNALGSNLERYHKIVNGAPDQIIQHNVTVQHIDQHVQLIQESIRETLRDMDVETSLRFMEIFNEKFSKLKAPTEKEKHVGMTVAEAQIINEKITEKLNDC